MPDPLVEEVLSEETSRGDDEDAHEVEITQEFAIGVFEVTREQYRRVTGIKKGPSYYSPAGGGKAKVKGQNTDQFPVEQVSWEEAKAFCDKLSNLPAEKMAGRKFRLPTEAEWEY